MNLFINGLLLGFSVAAPVGPIGILCINRTINKNFAAGFVSGLGAATVDLLFGSIAGLGLTIISNFLIAQKVWFQICGLALLIYLGIKTIRKKDKNVEFNYTVDKGLANDYLSTILVAVTNPITILFFTAAFTGLGLAKSVNSTSSAIQLITGVFTGSCLWWLILSGLTQRLKKKISKRFLHAIDFGSGILLLLFGLLILINLIRETV
jgi:threonine/homoserine/homoserine lactone efflux protein